MSLSCDYEDGPAVYMATEHTARKRHMCCECGDWIEPKERYLRCKGLWDGLWSVYNQHLLCAEACMYVRDKIQDGECLPFGSLSDAYGAYRKPKDKFKEFRSMLAKIVKRSGLIPGSDW